ncbi:MAG TPA: SHOCT domain-containing protein [Arthrobacter sp.]|nr:SHOCT domain-containing protein [Arthrobacter sp.]
MALPRHAAGTNTGTESGRLASVSMGPGVAEVYGWNDGMGLWGYALMSISMVVVWGAIITGIVLLARSLRAPSPYGTHPQPPRVAEDVLAERFARGEIDAAEYQDRLAVLRGHPGT